MAQTTKTLNTDSLFAKVQAKTGLSHEKIDAWQQKWLAMPKTRAKYKTLEDAPNVVGEELIAMSNDLIDYIQGQPGGKSDTVKKVKEHASKWFDKGSAFLKSKWDEMQANAKPEAPLTKTKKTA